MRKISWLEDKLRSKDEVLAELMEEYVLLKKRLADYEYVVKNSILNLLFFPIAPLVNLFRVGDTIEIWAKKNITNDTGNQYSV